MLIHRTQKRILHLVLLLMLLSTVPVAADMRIFTLQHRPAEELAETVRSLLDDQAKVAVHRNTLVVRATQSELAEVESLVAAFDQPLSMLQISIEQGYQTQSAGRDLSASGSVSKHPVRIDVFGRPGHEGPSVFVDSGETRLSAHAQEEVRRETRHANQVLSVIDGATASISVGRAVPFTSRLKYYARRHPHYVETVSYQRVDTGFKVIPHLRGNVVDAEVTPFMAYLDRENPQQIVFHEVSTQVRIPIGAWYDLSQHMQTHDDLSREILSAGAESNNGSVRVRIRIDPQ